MGFRSLFQFALLSLCAGMAAAQATINFASISGRITDQTGAVVQGAEVTARQIDTNLTSTLTTDQEGRFLFPYLRVGQIEIRVHKEGFTDSTSRVTLTIGSAFDLPISLAVASSQAEVSVTAETAVLEAARTQIAGTVSHVEVDSLPLNGRNFLDLALPIPVEFRPLIPLAISSLPKPPLFQAKAFRLAASAISPTALSSTVFRRTMTRRG